MILVFWYFDLPVLNNDDVFVILKKAFDAT